MVEIIFLVILIISFGGVLFILVSKIPALVALPQNGKTGIKKHQLILEVEEKIKEAFLYFEKQILLHRLLSWTKVITLRIETKIDHLLHNIRKKAQKVDKDLKEKK